MVLGMGGDSSNPIITAMNPGSSGSEDSSSDGFIGSEADPFSSIRESFEETELGQIVDENPNVDAGEVDIDGPADTSGNESLYSGSEPFWNNQDVNMGLPDFNPQGMIQDGVENFQNNTQNASENVQNLLGGLKDGVNLPGIGLQDFQNMLPGNNSGGSGGGGLGLFEKTLIAGVAIVTLPAVIKELGDN